MYRINHNDAIELEYQIRRLFRCERGGVSGLADADDLGTNPLNAAIMVVSYIHAKGLQRSETEYDEFLYRHENAFKNSKDKDMVYIVENYINELSEIIDSYV